MFSLFTCLKSFADTEAAVALHPLSLYTYIKIQAAGKIFERTAGICSVAAVLIALCNYLSKKAEATQGVGPSEHCSAGATGVLFRYDCWRTGS